MSAKHYVSTGLRPARGGGFWHLLVAVHGRWRFAFIRPAMKPNYRRLYIGPIEIEWSRP